MAEVDLYAPIKRFLEKQGYAVKGEIGECDIVAVRNDEGPVIVELKSQLNLALILQAVDRLSASSTVYIAFRVGKGQSASFRSRSKQVTSLLRRLGLGLLTVSARLRIDRGPTRPAALACSKSLANVSAIPSRAAPPPSSVSRPIAKMHFDARENWLAPACSS